MKRKLASDSGMTLVEIVAALVILVIMVAGFATLFSFAGTSVFISGHDSVANADSRAETELLLSGPIAEGAGTATQIGIDWREGHAEKEVDVTHESMDVPIVRGPDGSFDLYRRPDAAIDMLNPDQRPFPHIHTIVYDFNGGYAIIEGRVFYRAVEVSHAGIQLNEHNRGVVHPDGLVFSHWLILDTGETWVWNPREFYNVFRSMYLIIIWKEP